MRKYFLSILALLLVAQMGWAASVTAPANIPAYWASADGKAGDALWSAVSAATAKNYSSIGYNNLYDAYEKTDVYPSNPSHPDYDADKAGKIWDMYGECLTWKKGQCGNYDNVCDCYNREHSIPQSWWGGGTGGIGNDIFHVLPTDGKINGVRSNYEYGVVNGGTDWEGNKYGSAGSWSTDKKTIASEAGESVSGSGNVFEPKPQYKGDWARGIMGTIIKWEQNLNTGNSFFNSKYNAANNFGLTKKAVVLLMKWHREDPVSRKEVDRNNGIQETQGNRNPFIDYPYLAEYIWGEHAGETVDMSKLMPSTDPDFVLGVSDGQRNTTEPAITSPKGTIDVGSTNTTVSKTYDMSVKGVNLTDGNLTLSLSGSSYFSLATTTVSKANALAGYNVTVTYEPKAEGNHSTTLTINGCGVSNHQVTITGSCVAEHTLTWISSGLTQYTTAATNTVPPLPNQTPADCSDDRVFIGWTAQTSVTDLPSDLFTTPSAIDGPKTYYAVYADKETSGSGGSGSDEFNCPAGSVVNATITANTEHFTIVHAKGTGSNAPASYSPWRIYGGNTVTISGSYTITSVVITCGSNDYARIASNATITATGGSASASTSASICTISITGDVTSLVIKPSSQTRWSKIVINYTGGGSTTYSNYSTACSSTPTNYVTVTFMNNGSLFATKNGPAGSTITDIGTPSLTNCEGYTFECWSSVQYAADNTDDPITDYPGKILDRDTTYYAVYAGPSSGETDQTGRIIYHTTAPTCGGEAPECNATISIHSNNESWGSVSFVGAEGTSQTVSCGTTVTILASPNNGYRFVEWSDFVSTAQREVELTSDSTLTARFEESTPTVIEQTPTEWQSKQPEFRKVLINNQLFILRENKLWTITGQEVK